MSRDSVGLSCLLPEGTFLNCDEIPLRTVNCDSRSVQPGQIFVAVRGATCDGHRYLGAAVAAGATAVVVEQAAPDLNVAQCIVPCTATALARLSLASEGLGPTSLDCVGVTGTNGKTTTTWLLHSILKSAGYAAGLIGTICNHDGRRATPAGMTTPAAPQLATLLKQMRQHDATHCVLEVSSHALQQRRCDGLRFSAAAITSLSHDHLDYHQTFDRYINAKARIAQLLYTDAPLLLNADQPNCRTLADRLSGQVRTVLYAIDHPNAELSVEILRQTHRSQILRLNLAQGTADCRLRLPGRHNAENALAAAGLAEQMGITLNHIVEGLSSVHGIPGRMERIDEGQPFQVVVDYAHTPDALQRVAATLRKVTPGQLICVFGAGGNRDESKRRTMGEAAGAADLVILTSDNPRGENPLRIIEQIRAGLPCPALAQVAVDRADAIRRAFEIAEPGDTVLIAGKGHETTQDFGSHIETFDDRDVARIQLQRVLANEVHQATRMSGLLTVPH